MPEQQRRQEPAPTIAAARRARAVAEDERQRAAGLRLAVRSSCARSRTLVYELTCSDRAEATEIFVASLEALARLAGALDEQGTRGSRLLARLAPRRSS